jgi:hypothetical protein
MLAVKNSMNRRPACAPRAAISAGTLVLVTVRRMTGSWFVNKAFTPPMVVALESRDEEIVAQLMDAGEKSNEFDVVADFATPLPLMVIAELAIFANHGNISLHLQFQKGRRHAHA